MTRYSVEYFKSTVQYSPSDRKAFNYEWLLTVSDFFLYQICFYGVLMTIWRPCQVIF